jgi:multimeric flavodoxin WrbA
MKMKILGISGSPRKNGVTVAMLEQALGAAGAEGAETELFSVAGKNIQPCDGCWECTNTGKCHIQDDMQELYEKMLAADGIIFGTPVYFYSMTAQSKAVIDRSILFGHPEKSLTNKVGGVVVCAGSLGLADVLKDYSFYMVQRRMLPALQVSAYAKGPDDLKGMEKCMKALDDLGRQMVALVKLGFKYPPEFARGPAAFGTHTR